MNEELIGVLAETLGKTAAELSELMKTDTEGTINVDPIRGLMQSHLQNIETSKKQEGEGMGQRLAMKKIEDVIIKESGFDNPNGLKGADLVKSWYEAKTFDETEAITKLKEENENLKKSKQVTDDDIKKHKSYLELEKNYNKVLEDLPSKIEAAKNEVLTEYQKKERIAKAKGLGLPVFEKMKPILPEDAQIRKKQVDTLLLNDFEKFDYQFEGDEILVIDPDTGKRLENAYKQPITFENFVSGIAQKGFAFMKSDPKQSTGSKPGQSNPAGGNVTVPKDMAEYRKLMADKSISIEDKKAISEAFQI